VTAVGPDHDIHRASAAAYVLGALDPSERGRFEAHLQACETCRAEVTRFAPLPGLLALVDGAPASDAEETDAFAPRPEVLAGAVNRARAARRRERRTLRAWQGVAGVAVAAAVGLGVLTAGSSEEPSATPSTTVPQGVTVAFQREGQSDAAGTARLLTKGWGTEVYVDASGLPARDAYTLWAVAADGTRETAATWGPTSSGRTRCTGATSIATERLASLEIDDGDEVLLRARTA
jgi:anti-sigma-K factor RskA